MTRIALAQELKDLQILDPLWRGDWRFACDPAFERLFLSWGVDPGRILPQAGLNAGSVDGKAGQRFIVCTETPEAATQRGLKAFDMPSLGFFSQVAPRLAAGLPVRFAPKGNQPAALEYAILCLGRCGSTLVSRELAAAGCGRPMEHIRQPVQALLRARAAARFDFDRWWSLVRVGHTVDGVFATKLLFGYWKDTAPMLTDDERRLILDFLSRARIIHIERSDKAAQAVSEFMATRTGVWHLWKTVSREDYEAKSRAIEPDLDHMVHAYRVLTEDEAALKAMIADLGVTPIRLDFDDLVADPKGAIAAVATALGREPPSDFLDAPLALQSTTSEVHTMFRDRLNRELDRRGQAR